MQIMASRKNCRVDIFSYMAIQVRKVRRSLKDGMKEAVGNIDTFDLKYLYFVPFNTVFLYQVTSCPYRILKYKCRR